MFNCHIFCLDPALSENNGTYTRETANVIAQRFLDWNLIADVEGETVRGSECDVCNKYDRQHLKIQKSMASIVFHNFIE